MARNLKSDQEFLKDTQSIKRHLRAIFSNRGLPVTESRLSRIAGEIQRGERGFIDIRVALRPFAKKNGHVGIPGAKPESESEKKSDLRAIIEEEYSSLSWAIDHAELGPILKEAAEEEWTALKLQNAVQGTKWWKTRDQNQRQLEVIKQTDPAQHKRQLEDAKNTVLTLAQDLGVGLSERNANNIATQVLENGLDQRQTAQAILGKVTIPDSKFMRRIESGVYGGALSQAGRVIEETASDYLLDLDSSTRANWVRKIALGEQTEASFQQYAEKVALAQMPFLKDFIDQGLSPQEGLQPYRQTFAQMLEINPAEVNWKDPKYQRVIRVREGGEDRLATTSEASERIIEQFHDQWDRTNGAKQTATQLTSKIAEMFGRRA